MLETGRYIILFKKYHQTFAKVWSGHFTTSQLTMLYNDAQCQSH